MCNPMMMAVGSFAISGLQAVAQFGADQQAYDENEKYRLENIEAANSNARQQYNDTLTRMGQEQDAAGADKADIARQARAARATATVAAGESGASGLSVDALLGDFYGREAMAKDRIDQNTDWSLQQLQNEMQGIRSTAQDRGNSIRKGTPPSMFATGLKIAGAGLNSYGSYKGWTS